MNCGSRKPFAMMKLHLLLWRQHVWMEIICHLPPPPPGNDTSEVLAPHLLLENCLLQPDHWLITPRAQGRLHTSFSRCHTAYMKLFSLPPCCNHSDSQAWESLLLPQASALSRTTQGYFQRAGLGDSPLQQGLGGEAACPDCSLAYEDVCM